LNTFKFSDVSDLLDGQMTNGKSLSLIKLSEVPTDSVKVSELLHFSFILTISLIHDCSFVLVFLVSSNDVDSRDKF